MARSSGSRRRVCSAACDEGTDMVLASTCRVPARSRAASAARNPARRGRRVEPAHEPAVTLAFNAPKAAALTSSPTCTSAMHVREPRRRHPATAVVRAGVRVWARPGWRVRSACAGSRKLPAVPVTTATASDHGGRPALRLPGGRRIRAAAFGRRRPRDPGPPGTCSRTPTGSRSIWPLPCAWKPPRRRRPRSAEPRRPCRWSGGRSCHAAVRSRVGRADHRAPSGLRTRHAGRHACLDTGGRELWDQPADPAIARPQGRCHRHPGRLADRSSGLPPLPDGTSLPPTTATYARLYGTFADAWRVTDATSLFDYVAGTSTATYVKPGFPAQGAPMSFADLSPTAQSDGLRRCAAVTNPELRQECAYDVSVTGNPGFGGLYQATEPTHQGAGPSPTPPDAHRSPGLERVP